MPSAKGVWKIIAANLFGLVIFVLLNFMNVEVHGHGAIVDGGSEGVGPLIFIPILVAFGLFVIFANRKKGWSVLVVGGTGYLGSALVVKLLNRGDRVTVLDPFEFDDEILSKLSKNLDLRQVKGTVSNDMAMDEALVGCDSIIWIDEVFTNKTKNQNKEVENTKLSNGFLTFIQKVKSSKVKRLIFTSSMSVYGKINEIEISEFLEVKPSNKVLNYKAWCEDVLAQQTLEGVVVCTVRPSAIIGPGIVKRLEGELNGLISSAIKNRSVTIDDRFESYPYIHIDDMTDLYLFLLDQPGSRLDKKIFNIGFGQFSDFEFVELLKNVIGEDLTVSTSSSGDIIKRNFSFEKMSKELGFAPKKSVERAVKDLLQHLTHYD